ncbi:MAG: hypothetical protein KIS78_27280 [Labilithrix sp.]|nr:hypothetical protein [Labilithrix sp.]MCW5836134.1 hypothetical protein [Labilithrix sp.]
MNRRLPLGRLFGVDVFVDWSWIVTFVLATWTMVSLNRRLLPDLDASALAFASAVAAAGLFASLGAHELVRVVALRRRGLPVRRLTLFVLGGVTDVERKPASPKTEVLGALIAPAASLGIALVLACGVAIASAPLPRALDDLDRLGAPGVVLLEIAAASFVVAAVNLLPAYPLDGGRILRAALWKATSDVDRATRLAAWSGQIVGWSLVLVGLGAALLSGRGPGLAVGAWTAFVGWFIASAAAQGYEGVIAQRRGQAAR